MQRQIGMQLETILFPGKHYEREGHLWFLVAESYIEPQFQSRQFPVEASRCIGGNIDATATMTWFILMIGILMATRHTPDEPGGGSNGRSMYVAITLSSTYSCQ